MRSRSRSYCPFRFASALSSCAFHAALNFWSSAHRSVLLALLLLLALGAHGDVGGGGGLVVLFVGPHLGRLPLLVCRDLALEVCRQLIVLELLGMDATQCTPEPRYRVGTERALGTEARDWRVPSLGLDNNAEPREL